MKKVKAIFLCFFMALLSVMAVFCSCGDGSGDTDSGDSDDSSKSSGSVASTAAPEVTDSSEESAETAAPEQDYYAYLFAYFTGNDPANERIFFGVSTDGYKYRALNKGKYILRSESGTKCVRDPYIFRGNDGDYYMIATDMKSSLGWSSNRNMISWRSSDLINWEDETVIKVADTCATTRGADRVWAPQALWNEERGEYMIYFAMHSNVTGGKTVMFYAYSPDLKTLSTDPKLLYEPAGGNSAIDSDIIYHDGLYYMYYKDETSGGIKLTTSERMDGGYSTTRTKLVSPAGLAVEGSSIYKLHGEDGWLFICDAYTSGYFVMEKTDNLTDFTTLAKRDYSFNFTPRHGSVIPITKEQYDALLEAYPYR